jgi:segregation and condensation protein B
LQNANLKFAFCNMQLSLRPLDLQKAVNMFRIKNARGPLARRSTDLPPGNHSMPSVYRLVPNEAFETPFAPQPSSLTPFARDSDLALIEAALLAADEPLTPRRLAAVTDLKDAGSARRLVKKLQSMYEQEGSAFQVHELAGGFQLLTRSEYHRWLLRLRQNSQELRLSLAARETLAIVAYRQPIMRADIESVRGVQCGEVLRMLMEKGLVRIAGRHESLGRPVLYGTTKKFLQVFGLGSLKDLPKQNV